MCRKLPAQCLCHSLMQDLGRICSYTYRDWSRVILNCNHLTIRDYKNLFDLAYQSCLSILMFLPDWLEHLVVAPYSNLLTWCNAIYYQCPGITFAYLHQDGSRLNVIWLGSTYLLGRTFGVEDFFDFLLRIYWTLNHLCSCNHLQVEYMQLHKLLSSTPVDWAMIAGPGGGSTDLYNFTEHDTVTGLRYP